MIPLVLQKSCQHVLTLGSSAVLFPRLERPPWKETASVEHIQALSTLRPSHDLSISEQSESWK